METSAALSKCRIRIISLDQLLAWEENSDVSFFVSVNDEAAYAVFVNTTSTEPFYYAQCAFITFSVHVAVLFIGLLLVRCHSQ